FISAGALTNQGFFDNVGETRRNGIELNIDGRFGAASNWSVNYTLLDAAVRDSTTMPSHHHPLAVGGQIRVARGDELPLIPGQLFKAGMRIAATQKLSIGGDFFASSGQYFRGDEGNLVDRVDGYAVFNLRGEYEISSRMRMFANVDNVFD